MTCQHPLPHDQCTFITSSNCSDVAANSMLHYGKALYCVSIGLTPLLVGRVIWLPPQLPIHSVPPFWKIIWALLLFTVAAAIASERLFPSLRLLLSSFRFTKSLSTLTVLALGNGTFDNFIVYAASVSTGNSNIALGYLSMAVFTSLTLGVGAVAFLSPFNFVKRAFVRDVSFFTVVSCNTHHSWNM